MKKKMLASILIVLFVVSLAPTSVIGEPVFVFSGRGYGHGLGLSQYGAKGFAEKSYSYKTILSSFYNNTQLAKADNKIFRILVASDRPKVIFAAKKNFSVYSEPLKKSYRFHAGNQYQATVSAGRVLIKNLSGNKITGRYTAPLILKQGNGQRLVTADDNGYSNNVYRGNLKILVINNKIQIVNYIHSEHYLFGVVTREMPSSWPIEALKSQAVAARSYAFASIKKNTFFDLYATTMSQVYGGLNAENSQSIKAVKDTAQQVLTYNGKSIQAFYHSNSGGYTENNENVWGGTPIYWLRAAKSPYEGKDAVWPTNPSYSVNYIQKRLGVYSSATPWGVKGNLVNIAVVKRAVSPRVLSVKITGSGGVSFISGNKLKNLLNLRSTWFYINGK